MMNMDQMLTMLEIESGVKVSLSYIAKNFGSSTYRALVQNIIKFLR